MSFLRSSAVEPFKPHPLLRNPHLQTVVGRYWPGQQPNKKSALHEVKCENDDVLVLVENKPNRKTPFKKVMVLMHGLSGDADSAYMRRLAARLPERGWIVFRMNHRGCGQGAGRAKLTYHSGKSDDVARVLRKVWELYPDFPQIAVGFSLSGNALLKMLGEGIESAPGNLRGAIAVTPPIDLSLCAHELARPSRRIYDYRFVRQLMTAAKERHRQFPDFPDFRLNGRARLLDFDELCTAPLHGFESAEDYYRKCSAKQFIGTIKLPTVLIASADDPFIPAQTYDNLPQNPDLFVHMTEQGGHMGFLAAAATPLGDVRWLDYAVIKYAELLLANAKSPTSRPGH